MTRVTGKVALIAEGASVVPADALDAHAETLAVSLPGAPDQLIRFLFDHLIYGSSALLWRDAGGLTRAQARAFRTSLGRPHLRHGRRRLAWGDVN